MHIGIHQPNFLPWMGYFYKMAKCDVFVLLDHVEFTKKSFTKRVKIHKPNQLEEEQYITIPLQKHSDHSPINSLLISGDPKWQHKIKAQIHQSYHKAPYYDQVESLIDQFFIQSLDSNSFSQYTIGIIKYIAELLDLNPRWVISSELDIEFSTTGVNLEIVAHLNGQTYVSGIGAKKYQDELSYEENDIQLIYSDYPSYFNTLNLPIHFLNKSILSYLAYYSIEDIQKIINNVRLD